MSNIAEMSLLWFILLAKRCAIMPALYHYKPRISTDSDCRAFAPKTFDKIPDYTSSKDYKITNKRLRSCAKGFVQNAA